MGVYLTNFAPSATSDHVHVVHHSLFEVHNMVKLPACYLHVDKLYLRYQGVSYGVEVLLMVTSSLEAATDCVGLACEVGMLPTSFDKKSLR